LLVGAISSRVGAILIVSVLCVSVHLGTDMIEIAPTGEAEIAPTA